MAMAVAAMTSAAMTSTRSAALVGRSTPAAMAAVSCLGIERPTGPDHQGGKDDCASISKKLHVNPSINKDDAVVDTTVCIPCGRGKHYADVLRARGFSMHRTYFLELSPSRAARNYARGKRFNAQAMAGIS